MKTDLQVKNDVLDELEWEPSVNAAEIGVTVKDGIVTLMGTVERLPEKWETERAAQHVTGVKAIANEIEVKLPGESKRTDADIALAAVNALDADTRVPRDHIKVSVEHGRITLTGEVEWYYQKRAAEEAVHVLWGVKAVSNAITLQAKVTPMAVKDKIETALKRSADVDAHGIRVETHQEKVILRGTVHSWGHRIEAGRAAWSAPGVKEVENQIEVV
jgi:osmotically-inducible protein OsmY